MTIQHTQHELRRLAAFYAPAHLLRTTDLDYAEGATWFVVKVLPGSERRIERRLHELTVRTYVPLTTEWRKQSKRQIHLSKPKVQVQRALFQGYLFASLPYNDLAFSHITDTEGVQAILGDNGSPQPVPGNLIELLRERQEQGAFDKTIVAAKGIYVPKWLRPGVPITITSGPFAAFAATVVKALPHDVVRIEAMMFGQVRPVDVPLAAIAPTA